MASKPGTYKTKYAGTLPSGSPKAVRQVFLFWFVLSFPNSTIQLTDVTEWTTDIQKLNKWLLLETCFTQAFWRLTFDTLFNPDDPVGQRNQCQWLEGAGSIFAHWAKCKHKAIKIQKAFVKQSKKVPGGCQKKI